MTAGLAGTSERVNAAQPDWAWRLGVMSPGDLIRNDRGKIIDGTDNHGSHDGRLRHVCLTSVVSILDFYLLFNPSTTTTPSFNCFNSVIRFAPSAASENVSITGCPAFR
jgi:hypothetical protein